MVWGQGLTFREVIYMDCGVSATLSSESLFFAPMQYSKSGRVHASAFPNTRLTFTSVRTTTFYVHVYPRHLFPPPSLPLRFACARPPAPIFLPEWVCPRAPAFGLRCCRARGLGGSRARGLRGVAGRAAGLPGFSAGSGRRGPPGFQACRDAGLRCWTGCGWRAAGQQRVGGSQLRGYKVSGLGLQE